MVKQIRTRFIVVRKKAKNGEAFYRSPRIYFSTKLTDDSSFPFKDNDDIIMRIDGKHLVIRKTPRKYLAKVDASENVNLSPMKMFLKKQKIAPISISRTR